MVVNILPADWTLGVGSKFNFQNMLILHIKLNGITNAATW